MDNYNSLLNDFKSKLNEFIKLNEQNQQHIKRVLYLVGKSNFIQKNTFDMIKDIFTAINEQPKYFSEFEEIIDCFEELIILTKRLTDSWIPENDEQQQINSDQNKFVENIFQLEYLAKQVFYFRKIEFMYYVLEQSNKKEILYLNTLLTNEAINKKYRKLALNFHPDKSASHYIPNLLRDYYNCFCDHLFKFILVIKNELIADIYRNKEINLITKYEEEGNKFWQQSTDCRNASKGEWNKLKKFTRTQLSGITTEDLKHLSNFNTDLAFENYKAACFEADKQNQFSHQIKLRGYMALCLYSMKRYLDAQLYALSSIMLIYRYSNKATQKDLYDAKQIFEKVKGGDKSKINSFKMTSEVSLLCSNNSLVTVAQSSSYLNINAAKDSLSEDLDNLSKMLIVKADRSLVSFESELRDILIEKRKPNLENILAALMLGTIIIVPGVLQYLLIKNFKYERGYQRNRGYFIRFIFDSPRVFSRTRISENLNKIIKVAYDYYDEENYQKFVEELSKDYDPGKSLLFKSINYFNFEELINSLIFYGFRSDGIAYLLNTIGEVLISGRIKLTNFTGDELKEQGKIIFKEIINNKLLEEEAKILDERIKQRRDMFLSRVWKTFIGFFGYESTYVTEKNVKEYKELSFMARLEEMRNNSRINLAIIDVLSNKRDAKDRAKKLIGDVRDSINTHFQNFGVAKNRLEVLEDFLYVISGEEFSRQEPEIKQLKLL